MLDFEKSFEEIDGIYAGFPLKENFLELGNAALAPFGVKAVLEDGVIRIPFADRPLFDEDEIYDLADDDEMEEELRTWTISIHRFHEDHNDDALFEILQILRDSDVWIPCNAIVGEEDQKTVEQMIEEAGDDLDAMVGKEFTSQDNIRLVPDILQQDDQYFFPVFSTEEDMGEYGEHFSQVQESFLKVIELARDRREQGNELTGIVINAFTEMFILPKELYEGVERMPSRIE